MSDDHIKQIMLNIIFFISNYLICVSVDELGVLSISFGALSTLSGELSILSGALSILPGALSILS